jgi:hypothetical protein
MHGEPERHAREVVIGWAFNSRREERSKCPYVPVRGAAVRCKRTNRCRFLDMTSGASVGRRSIDLTEGLAGPHRLGEQKNPGRRQPNLGSELSRVVRLGCTRRDPEWNKLDPTPSLCVCVLNECAPLSLAPLHALSLGPASDRTEGVRSEREPAEGPITCTGALVPGRQLRCRTGQVVGRVDALKEGAPGSGPGRFPRAGAL